MGETYFPKWMGLTLKLAGVYNILWGAYVVLLPNSFFQLAGMPLVNYPAVWQSVGMIVGVYGLGYYLASYDPYKHWIIIMVGFLGKLFGPIGAIMYVFKGELPLIFMLNNVTNDLIWLVPFAIILYKTWKKGLMKP